MAEPTEPTEELKEGKLIRVRELHERSVRFLVPEDSPLVDFGDRGLLPLSEGWIYETTSWEPGEGFGSSLISLELFGFDEAIFGSGEPDFTVRPWRVSPLPPIVSGVWGPRGHRTANVFALEHRGGLDLLPDSLVRDAFALLADTHGATS